MKDPILLCPICKGPAQRVRKRSGFRCTTQTCKNFGVICCTDGQVVSLKLALKAQEEQELWQWAASKNPKIPLAGPRNLQQDRLPKPPPMM